MIHFDTNYLVLAGRTGTPQAAAYNSWVLAGQQFGVSAMAWAEFMCGPVTSAEVATAVAMAGGPIPLTAADAVEGARLFNRAGRRRGSLADCLVATVALGARAALATDNRADFAPFASVGLRLLP